RIQRTRHGAVVAVDAHVEADRRPALAAVLVAVGVVVLVLDARQGGVLVVAEVVGGRGLTGGQGAGVATVLVAAGGQLADGVGRLGLDPGRLRLLADQVAGRRQAGLGPGPGADRGGHRVDQRVSRIQRTRHGAVVAVDAHVEA